MSREFEANLLQQDLILPDIGPRPIDLLSHHRASTIFLDLEDMLGHHLRGHIGRLHLHHFLQAAKVVSTFLQTPETPSLTYSGDQAGDVCSNLRVNYIFLAVCPFHGWLCGVWWLKVDSIILEAPNATGKRVGANPCLAIERWRFFGYRGSKN